MGAYINPPDETKETFLIREGLRLFKKPKWEDVREGFLPVVLMDNGLFTAAGIAYSKSELKAFTRPDDPRPKTYYIVKIDKLLKVSDLERYLG